MFDQFLTMPLTMDIAHPYHREEDLEERRLQGWRYQHCNCARGGRHSHVDLAQVPRLRVYCHPLHVLGGQGQRQRGDQPLW